MSVQIYSYGACIRMVTDNSVMLLAKSQIKSVEAVRDDSIKISLGEGPLNEIIIKLSDVTMPSGLLDVAALRDAVAHMLDHSNLYEDEALQKMQALIDHFNEIKLLINLWQGNVQIDLNFQQLQVNALVAINNRLLETRDNDERMLSQAQQQVAELKSLALQLVSFDGVIAAIKTANQTSLSNQDIQTNELRNITGKLTGTNSYLSDTQTAINQSLTKLDNEANILTASKVILADILTELKAHTSKLGTIDTALADNKTQNTSSLSKQDSMITLLTAIKNK